MLQDKKDKIINLLGSAVDEVAKDAGCSEVKLYTAIRKKVDFNQGKVKSFLPYLNFFGLSNKEVSEIVSTLDKLYLEV